MISKMKLQPLLYLRLELVATPVDIFDIYRASLTDRLGLALLKYQAHGLKSNYDSQWNLIHCSWVLIENGR